MTHSIPDACAVAIHTELGDGADHRRLQVRPDAGRRRARRHRPPGRARPRGHAAAVRRLDERRPRRATRPASASSGPKLEEVFSRCEGRIVVTSFASNIHRVQQVVDAAAALDRKVALVGRSMRKNVNIGRSLGPHRRARGDARPAARDRRLPRPQARDHVDRLPGRADVARCAAWRTTTTRRSSCTSGDTVVFSRDADPRQRARGQRDDRPALPHRLRRDHDRATRRSTPPGTATRRRSS